MGAMPTISLSEKEKKVVTAPFGETGLLRMMSSTHQFTGIVIAMPKRLYKPSNEKQATSCSAEVLCKVIKRDMNKYM